MSRPFLDDKVIKKNRTIRISDENKRKVCKQHGSLQKFLDKMLEVFSLSSPSGRVKTK